MRTYTPRPWSALATMALVAAGCADGADPTGVTTEPSLSRQAVATAQVRVTPPSDTLDVGATLQVAGTVVDGRGRTLATRITWTSDDAKIATVSAQGLVTGVTAGVVVVRAASGAYRGATTITVTAPTAAPVAPSVPTSVTPSPAGDSGAAGPWTYCTDAGAVCPFIGRRAVRLGPVGGPYVTQVAYGQVPCAVYGFGDRNPAPGRALHCDTGPLLTTTLANPMPGMGPLGGATVVVPRGGDGAAGPQTTAAGAAPVPTGSGSFRTTCGLATYAFNDPIVFPGRPGAAHLHAFFGNTAADAASTPETLVASGHSTCRGGTLNRTAYWVPALVDARTGAVLPSAEAVIYYKTGYNVDPPTVQPFPAGLRMIAGDMRAPAAQAFVTWGCRDRWLENPGTVPTTCPVGDAVRLTVQFPQCWDGVHLDAPDHKSHMAYPVYRNAPERSTCPATHPVMLPELTEHFDYPVIAGAQPAFWRLSSDFYDAARPGGLSAHADWMNGWDPATLRTLVTQCLNRSVDCGVGNLGDGRALY